MQKCRLSRCVVIYPSPMPAPLLTLGELGGTSDSRWRDLSNIITYYHLSRIAGTHRGGGAVVISHGGCYLCCHSKGGGFPLPPIQISIAPVCASIYPQA